jgi:hypothetical protein
MRAVPAYPQADKKILYTPQSSLAVQLICGIKLHWRRHALGATPAGSDDSERGETIEMDSAG